MDRRDIAMVNDSMGRLGDSLLRERMNSQDQANRETARGDRKAEFDATMGLQKERVAAQDKQYGAQQAHWGKIEEATKLQAQFKKLSAQKQEMHDRFASLGELVRGGFPNEEANRFVVETVDGLEDEDIKREFQKSPQYQAAKSGKIDWSKVGAPKPLANNQPADVETDVAASQLEAQAAKEADPAMKQILMDRAKQLRSGIGRQDPGAFIEETKVIERGPDGRPVVSQKRRIPAGQTNKPEGKSLTVEQAKEFLKQSGGDKDKARELARKAGYTF